MGRWLSDGWLGNVFSPLIKVQAGGGVSTLTVGGIISAQVGLTTNVSASASILYSYTMPANSFNKNGQYIRMRAWGSVGGVASGTTASVTVNFGSIAFSIGAATTGAVTNWQTELLAVRSGASAQEFFLTSGQNTGGTGTIRQTSATEPDTAAIVIKITATSAGGGTNGNISARAMIVEFGTA